MKIEMRFLFTIALLVLLPAAGARAGVSVSALYDPGSGITLISTSPEIPPGLFWQWVGNDDGSATFHEMPWMPGVIVARDGTPYESRFDVCSITVGGRTYRNVNRLTAFRLLSNLYEINQ
jgi:hypothetical protein